MSGSAPRKGPLFALLLGPPALWLTAFFLIPMAVIWAYSFGENASLTSIAVDGSPKAYLHALSPLYLGIVGKSLALAAITTLACLIVGFPMAVAIAFAKAATRPWLLLMVMLPFFTNLLIRTYALIAILRTEGYANLALGALWGLAAAAAHVLGLPLSPFRPLELLHNGFAVVVGLVYVELPFMVLPIWSVLDRLDRSLLEASLDLGASHLATFARIVVPLAIPGILSGALLTFIPSAGAYLTPDLLGGPSDQMIATIIERQFKAADDWPFGSALSFLLMYLTFAAIAGQALAGSWRRDRR